jgi:hypothetical protein
MIEEQGVEELRMESLQFRRSLGVVCSAADVR